MLTSALWLAGLAGFLLGAGVALLLLVAAAARTPDQPPPDQPVTLDALLGGKDGPQ